MKFAPGKIPSNEYAFYNNLYLNTVDYNKFLQQNGNRQPVFGKMKGFVLKLEALDCPDIPQGHYGSSGLQKEMMRVSKIESVDIGLERVREPNPLIEVHLGIEHVFLDPSCPIEPTGVVKIDSEEIQKKLTSLYNGKYLNSSEQIPVQLKEGKLIIKVVVNSIDGA